MRSPGQSKKGVWGQVAGFHLVSCQRQSKPAKGSVKLAYNRFNILFVSHGLLSVAKIKGANIRAFYSLADAIGSAILLSRRDLRYKEVGSHRLWPINRNIGRVKVRLCEPICTAGTSFSPNALCIWRECGANPGESGRSRLVSPLRAHL
jgi:hypothetical protein